jgi:hypothetical protein
MSTNSATRYVIYPTASAGPKRGMSAMLRVGSARQLSPRGDIVTRITTRLIISTGLICCHEMQQVESADCLLRISGKAVAAVV